MAPERPQFDDVICHMIAVSVHRIVLSNDGALTIEEAVGNGDGKLPHGKPGFNCQIDIRAARHELKAS